jgi:hypothetical protein
MFYEREICKTGIMVEHPVEDIIERVGCQFYTKVSGEKSVVSSEMSNSKD